MRALLFSQVVSVAFLLSGCPGAPASDPTGGGTCPKGESCTSTGGQGGSGGKDGSSTSTAATTTSTSGGGGEGNGSSSSGSATGGAGGAGGNGQGGSGGGNSAACDKMQGELVVSEESSKACATEAPKGTQCTQSIQGICCAIPVTNANSPEVLAYLEALKAYQQMGCMAKCPPDPCPPTDKADCVTNAGGNGSCVLP